MKTDDDEGNYEATCVSEPCSDFVWSSLPEELLHNVLQRLPIESVMKFRRVCRTWNQFLMSSCFSQSFHHTPGKLIPLYLDERAITLYSSRTKTWLSHKLESCLAEVPFLQDEDNRFLHLVASGGGLLSFMARGVTGLQYLIYNPLTEQTQRMQPTQESAKGEEPLSLILPPDTVTSKVLLHGIYVDFETGFYSFVVVDPGSLNHESATLIYDSRLCSWKVGRKVPRAIIQLDSSSPPRINGSIGCKSQCVTTRGKLYWMVEHDDGSDSVFVYDLKLDRWAYIKCITDERITFFRLLEHEDEVLLVGKRGARVSLDPFCYFEIVELSGSSSTDLSSLLHFFRAPSFVDGEHRFLHLRERVNPFKTIESLHIDGRRRSDAGPSWCIGGGNEVYFLLESRLFDSVPSGGGRTVRFTSPMVRFSSADLSWTWLTNWKIRDEESGILKPDASNRVWAFQPSLIHP